MQEYSVLNKQRFSRGNLSIVPIRFEDRLKIMKWRNEQMYHLRQDKKLTVEDQNKYFNTVVQKLFRKTKPEQILFSYLEDDLCIGYGGLVHINWIDLNAEISFIMDTTLENNFFHNHWTTFLQLVEELGYKDLNFHKLYVYAFDVRQHLYEVLKENDYFLDAALKEHCQYEGNFIDVVIYSKINKYETWNPV